jgi:hypothetical protein
MKKQTGVWLDLRNAYIIHLPPLQRGFEAPETIHLTSGIEESAATGGTRSVSPWGPQGGDVHRSAQERRHHEEKHYFTAVIDVLRRHQPDELVIFGPSEAKHGLANALEACEDFKPNVVKVQSADQMPVRQLVAWVRSFFERPAPRRLPKRP